LIQNNNFQNSKNRLIKKSSFINNRNANITNQNNYFIAENILANHFFKHYFEFRNIKGKNEKIGKVFEITIIKIVRFVIYLISSLFFMSAILFFILGKNNFISIEHASNSLLSTFFISLALCLVTFIHYKIDLEFEHNKSIEKLELKDCDKGRFYFKIDLILLAIIFCLVVFI